MVRIVQDEKKLEPEVLKKLDPASEVLLQVIGIMVADNPLAVRDLLEDYSVETLDGISDQELTDLLLDAIQERDAEFNHELATVILDCTLESGYDSFDFKSLLGKGGNSQSSQEADQSAGNGGLITGITSTLGKIGDGIKGRLNRDQATSQTLQGIYAYKTQLSATQQTKAKSKKNMLIAIVAVLGLSFIGLMIFMSKRSAAQTVLKTG